MHHHFHISLVLLQPWSQQAGAGTLWQALSRLPPSGKCSGGDAEWCQHQHKSVPPAWPFHQQQSFWEASGSRVILSVAVMTIWAKGGNIHHHSWWVLPVCGSHRLDTEDAAVNELPSPLSCVHLRTPGGTVMTKGIDSQMPRQKFSAVAGNWYKWLQMSHEAERVLTMQHRDLRDSCRELPPSLLLAESANAVRQCLCSSHPFTLLLPSSISPVSRSTFASRPSPPECCCGRANTQAWNTVQKGSVNYATVISHQQTHSLTADGRWTNTCRLSGAEREADLFPELVTLISPSWSCEAECASVIYSFFFKQSYVAVMSVTKSSGIFGMFLGGNLEGEWKASLLSIALEVAWIHTSMNWISKS